MTFERMIEKVLAPIRSRVMKRVAWKELNELSYWKRRKAKEGVLSNDHYEYFYTIHFDLAPSFYDGKVILDLGCGPRGSLEWATNTKRRIGLDPLADAYLKLGANKHSMEYMSNPSEDMPLKDGELDALFSFNSLDHVEDIDKTISEIKRVVKPGGVFLLLVDINHEPTDCEPHNLSPRFLLEAFSPEFTPVNPEIFLLDGEGMYGSIKNGKKADGEVTTFTEAGYFSAMYTRNDV